MQIKRKQAEDASVLPLQTWFSPITAYISTHFVFSIIMQIPYTLHVSVTCEIFQCFATFRQWNIHTLLLLP